jgi:GNAT superfamily N-acetyltransferase
MKCIGVNHWAGVDPGIAEVLSDLEKWADHSRRAEQERVRHMSPAEKFVRFAKDRFQQPKLFGIAPVQGYWQIGKWALAEMRRISLNDACDSGSYLIHLQSLYVVDAARGQGEGKRAIEQIKKLADECGCGVTLFAKSFAFSKDEHLPYALQTFEELRKAALEEEWPVIYLPEWDIDCLRFFYEGCGFRNMCLYDSWVYNRPKEEDLPFDRQFVYLPSSMNPAWRKQIEHRLNRDVCEFCNR